jgi:cytochrome c556
MRNALLAATAVLLLAGCGKSADNPAANADTPSGQVLPIRDNAMVLVRAPSKPQALKLMHDRHENMEQIGKAFKIAGRELKAGAPNLAAVRSSAATIAGFAPRVPSWFPPGTGPDVGKTMAKPEVWQKPADFASKTKAFQGAALAFNAAARAGDMAAINARFGDLGKTCKACHDGYRNEHKK